MVYRISMGSNRNRRENMAWARRRLSELFPDIRFSTEEETEPLFLKRSDPFSNQVACFTSGDRPEAVSAKLKALEKEAGRTPAEKKQEIVRLDLDVLACDAAIYRPADWGRDYIRRGLKELEQLP